MKDNPLSVKLVIDDNIEVVLFLCNINWDVHAGTANRDRNWLGIVLVFKEYCEFLVDGSKLIWYKYELDFLFGISIDICCSFE